MLTQTSVNEIAYQIVACAIEVHKQVGPGLLESVYHECMIEELIFKGFKVKSQVPVSLYYRQKQLKGHLVLDLLVEDCVVVELKAVDEMHPVHKAQLLSYLKLTGNPKGVLINFHADTIVKQAVHLVSETFAHLPPN